MGVVVTVGRIGAMAPGDCPPQLFMESDRSSPRGWRIVISSSAGACNILCRRGSAALNLHRYAAKQLITECLMANAHSNTRSTGRRGLARAVKVG